MTDFDPTPYTAAAEFYDLMATPYVAQVEPVLAPLLAAVDTVAGPVVDFGAKTGLSTVAIADALPDADIIAVEPAPAMRAVLMSRLAARKDLRERITLLPTGFLDTELPDRCAAVIALGGIGHFDPAARASVWSTIATALAPGASVVIEIQHPEWVVEVSERRFTQARAGALRYEGWSAARPIDEEALIWRMTYRSYRDEVLLQETTTEHLVWPADANRLQREAQAVNLMLAAADADTGLLRFTKERQRR